MTGLAGSGLVLRDNGGDDLSITHDGSFTFASTVADGGSYVVTVAQQPSNPAQLCTVIHGGGLVTDADVTDVAVTCVTQLFSVGGTLSGLSGSGLVLQDNAGDDLPVAANGAFTFTTSLQSGTAFTVTVKTQPGGPNQTCHVSGGSGIIGAGPVTSVLVHCDVNTYAVGGTVTGLAGSGLVLQDNNGDDLSVTASGAFAFSTAVASGQPFSVAVKSQPTSPSQTCLVTSGSGTVVSSDVTTVGVSCTTNSYTVGGTVSGLSGSGLVLQDNLGDNLSIAAGQSTFVFGNKILSGVPYRVTVLTQPSSPSQTCTVDAGEGSVVASDVSSVSVSCVTHKYNVAVTVTGLAGTGLALRNNGADDLVIPHDGTFTFATQVASGADYSVAVVAQPANPSQTCTVSGGTGTVGAGDASVTLNCSTNAYAISGTVTGLAGSGLSLTLNNGPPLAVTGTSFSFPNVLPSGTAYTIAVASQPTTPWQTCTIANSTGTVTSGDVTHIAVTCVTNSYSISGTVTGLKGSGLVLQNNEGDNLSIDADGTFTFATKIPSGSPYLVEVLTQPSNPAQTCTVSSGSGDVSSGDIASVAIRCVTNTYRIQGTLSGLAATVVLQNDGGDNLTLTANGTFTFPTRIASGSTYAVAVISQPNSPSQICSVANGTGTVVSSDVTNVSVSCVTQSYVVGGSISGLSGSGLTLLNNGTDAITVTGTSFQFPTRIASGATYAVTIAQQPSSPSQTCALSGDTGTVGASDVTSVVINCTTNAFSVGGEVTNLAGSGLQLTNGSDTLPISGNGNFAFPTLMPSGSAYAVTVTGQPTNPWQTCTATNASGTVGSGPVTSVAVNCITNLYVVHVTVTGDQGSGLVLQNSGGDNVTVSGDGSYTFPTSVPSGAAYRVTVLSQPTSPWQTCTVASGSGTVSNSDVSVAVSCTTNTYSIGGTVSGLSGAGLVLRNGTDNLAVSASGSFTFGTKVASGATYAVAVASQPSGQTCSVINASGTVRNAAVINVAVTCDSSKIVFVTSKLYLPTFGGARRADSLCQGLATAAGLGGTFMAWVSDSTTSPAMRFSKSTAPYKLVNGTVVWPNGWTTLTTFGVYPSAPINVTELNTPAPASTPWLTYNFLVWTGTNSDGTAVAGQDYCANWTSTSGSSVEGRSDSATPYWTDFAVGGVCGNGSAPLYCFQQ